MQSVFFLSALTYLLLINFGTSSNHKSLYSNTWAVEVDGGEEEANRIAAKYGYINLGQVGSLKGIFHFRHKKHPRRLRRSLEDETKLLYEETTIKWAEQQVIKRRVKRHVGYTLNDPLFSAQWYLHNTRSPFIGYDHNVIPVWKQGVYGKDIVVSILDDGIEMTHKDLAANYDPKASYDFNDNDPDPTPRRTWANENRHGTRCAGEVAAVANNSKCIVGVAPEAKIGGVRMLDGEVTDVVEARSLNLENQHIEIYSASWGPDDDGMTVDGPGPLARRTFEEGISEGRGGLGSIYVWASGNGGHYDDNCNCDGYTNSIYTLSISSATEYGGSPWYSESCSSTLAATFSSGGLNHRKIVTTDLNNVCTKSHTGTSASAPIAAGILALALEVNRNLTWRDMQHIVVRTSQMDKLNAKDIVRNGVGRSVSHSFGYGLLDAEKLVGLARIWKTVPTQHVCQEIPDAEQRAIPSNSTLTVEKETTGCKGTSNEVKYLEHVEAVISLSFSKRGDLVLYLTSPKGTRSTLLAKRVRDKDQRVGFHNWAFMTTHCWGENPQGKWKLEARNAAYPRYDSSGTIKNWSLRFYGTSQDPDTQATRAKNPVSACDVECNGCRGPGPDKCDSCTHYRRKATGECVSACTKNEYARGKECFPCSPTCHTCNGPSSTNCLSCLPPLLLMNKKCVSLCPPTWYKSQNKCVKCDSTCQSCTGKAKQCTSCKSSHKLVGFSCQPFCSPGFYKKDTRCVACDPQCLECSTGGPNGCTKCINKLHFYKGKCLKICPRGTYGDQITHGCKQCHPTCIACSGQQADDCLSCIPGLFRIVEPRGLCKSACPKGRYPVTSEAVCLRCDQNCLSCNKKDPTKCTSCVDGKFLDNSKCISPQNCPNQTYPNQSSKRCSRCYSDCQTCSGPATNQCLSCVKGYYLYKSKCVLRCPITTFPTKRSCQECPKNCTSCYSTSKCLSCESPFVLHESQCISKCPSTTFKDHSKKQCIPCHPSCKSCNASLPDSCLSCKDGFTLNRTTCMPKCPRGETSTKIGCSKCHSSCASCSGTTDKDCISCTGVKFLNLRTNTCSYKCPDGYYGEVKMAICKACPIGCKTCVEPRICQVCEAGLVKNGNVCELHCPEGRYMDKDSKSCSKCDPTCLECSGKPNYCIKCHSQRFLSDNNCTNICPSGSFHERQSNKCKKCDNGCAECSGPSFNDCTKCAQGLLKVGKTCLQSCPSGYFYNAQKELCNPCDYFCQECKNGNGLKNCTKCISPYVLHLNYCIRECSSHGWFLDKAKQKCQKCHPSCRKCLGPTARDCISCHDPNSVLHGFSCLLKCPNGFIKNEKTHRCQKCHPTCTSCSGIGQNACTACVHGLILHKMKGKAGECHSNCEPHKFKNKSSMCQPCHSSCHSCYGPTNTNCLSCNKGYVYYKNTCHKSCPAGTFLKSIQERCLKCHPLCKTCTGPMPNQCKSCMSSFFLEQSTCVIQCSSKMKADVKTKRCKSCSNCQGQAGKPKNRSVQDQSIKAIRFILDDPKRNGALPFAVMSVVLCLTIFIIVLGVLQLHSSWHLCFKKKYTIIKADFKHADEDDGSLTDCDFESD